MSVSHPIYKVSYLAYANPCLTSIVLLLTLYLEREKNTNSTASESEVTEMQHDPLEHVQI